MSNLTTIGTGQPKTPHIATGQGWFNYQTRSTWVVKEVTDTHVIFAEVVAYGGSPWRVALSDVHRMILEQEMRKLVIGLYDSNNQFKKSI